MPGEATRFKPGQSGNPRGAPKGNVHLDALLRKALRSKISVSDGKKITAAEALMLKTVQGGLQGDTQCIKIILDRVMGPVVQAVDMKVSDSAADLDLSKFTPEQRAAICAANEALAEADK